MTMYDPKAEMLLELARLAPEPGAVARARNLAALRVRLAVPMPPTASDPRVAPSTAAPATPAPATPVPATPVPATPCPIPPSLAAAPRVAPAPAAPLVPNAPLAALPRGESSLVSASLRQLAGARARGERRDGRGGCDASLGQSRSGGSLEPSRVSGSARR